jgi:oligopeptide transport system ATP-binding protein
VMYAGRVAERASTRDLFARPRHPYTAGLFESLPQLDSDAPLAPIAGTVPDALHFPSGCRFHPRCPHAMPVCAEREPPLAERGGGAPHVSACFYVDEHPDVDLLARRQAP